MPYTIISIVLNVLGAVYAGFQFGRIINPLRQDADAKKNLPLQFSSGLLAFAIPFFSPVSHNVGSSASFFIAVAAATALIVGRSSN